MLDTPSSTRNVIVVEDQSELRQVVCLFLKTLFEVNVYEAADGVEALELLSSMNNIDLIITDLNMPNMDGLEMTKNIRKMATHRTTPIIMLTSEDEENRAIALSLGVNEYFSKPMSPEALMPSVKSYLS